MRKNLRISFTGVILISCIQALLHGESDQAKKDIVIFRTDTGEITSALQELQEPLKETENQVRELFSNLSGFNVRLLDYHLASGKILPFLEKIRAYSAAGGEVPDKVEIENMVFSKKDFTRIVNSYLLVIPVLTFYNIEESAQAQNATRYKAGLRLSYTIINTKEAKVLSTVVVESTGFDADRKQALLDALEDIPVQLNYEVRSLDVFSLADRIVELIDPDVVIKLGTDRGVSVGDEFAILSLTPAEAEKGPETRESGLVIIHDKEAKVSVGRVIYADEPPAIGTPVKAIPRLGLEMVPYVHMEMDFLAGTYYGWSGVKLVLTKGFFTVEPVVGFEAGIYPFERLNDELPLRVFGGLDVNIFLGRFQLIGMAAVGTEMITATSANSRVDGFDFSAFGLFALATVSYLVTRDLKLMLDVGYEAWFAYSDKYTSYEGWVLGVGAGIKL